MRTPSHASVLASKAFVLVYAVGALAFTPASMVQNVQRSQRSLPAQGLRSVQVHQTAICGTHQHNKMESCFYKVLGMHLHSSLKYASCAADPSCHGR